MNKDKARIRNWRFQDKPCIWWAGGAAFSLPHYVNRFQRSTSSEHSLSFCLPGRYFLSFWGPMKTDSKHQKDYIIDVFDRATHTKGWQNHFSNYLNLFLVRRLSELHGKPDIVRVVSELGIVLLSYPSLLMVEVLCWFENYMLFGLPSSAFLILFSST